MLYLDVSCLRTPRISGIGRYALELRRALIASGAMPLQDVMPASRYFRYGTQVRAHGVNPSPYLPAGLGLGKPSDVVHGPDFRVPGLSRARRVVTVHDLVFTQGHLVEAAWAHRARTDFEAMLRWGRPDAIIAVSAFVAGQISSHYPAWASRTHVVHHGADHLAPFTSTTGTSAQPPNQGRPYLLCLGTLERRKNQVLLVQAYYLAAQSGLEVDLVLIGQDGYGAQAVHAAIAAGAGCPGRVVLPGYVPEAALPVWLSGALAMVYPSLYEGFGFPILEAMACDTPVLASQEGAVAEVCGNAALSIDVSSLHALTMALLMLYHDAPLRHRLSVAGLARWAQFTWARCAAETMQVYEG